LKTHRILIVGASGFVGKNLALEFAQTEHLSVLARPTSDIGLFKNNPRIRIIFGDLETNQGLAEALNGIDVVIDCAAKNMGRSYWEFYLTNVQGTANLINAMLKSNVRKLLYLSSHAACGPCSRNEPLSEHDPAKPVSFYGRTKKMAEDLVTKSGLSYTFVRPVSVYGPHDKEILTYVKLLHHGICPVVGFGPKYVNLIYVKDLVQLIVKIVHQDHFTNSIYFANDGQCYSFDALLEMIAHALHKRNLKIHVPRSFALLIGLLNDVFMPAEKRLVTRDKVRELACQFWVCSSADIDRVIGFKPRYKFEHGIAETIDWYRKQGCLG
jgi:nucleoside-diphosphate-sugar epimerase